MNFKNWLVEQQYRQDTIGALARVSGMQIIEHKVTRRKPDEHRIWTNIVIALGEPRHIDAFNDAWQEFRTVKNAANDISVADGVPSQTLLHLGEKKSP